MVKQFLVLWWHLQSLHIMYNMQLKKRRVFVFILCLIHSIMYHSSVFKTYSILLVCVVLPTIAAELI